LKERLFVYGTLMKRRIKATKLPVGDKMRFVGIGEIEAELYDLGEFPGAIENSGLHVCGEVYEISSVETLRNLDVYEGYNPADPSASLFTRRKTVVSMKNGKKTVATVYFFNRNVDGLKKIYGGKWTKR
jgi:gamma-glutamylcyclotransferase (GGCT)/AIG2-like uncharacterized protein YtfP